MLSRMIRYRHYLPYCFEALFYLALSKFWILCRPFNAYTSKLGVTQCETLKSDMQIHEKELTAIRLALRTVSLYLPWHSACLDQALAAQRLLSRRGLPCTFYFGVARGQDYTLLAHAWIRSGNQWIIGYQPEMNYYVVASYATFARHKKMHFFKQ